MYSKTTITSETNVYFVEKPTRHHSVQLLESGFFTVLTEGISMLNLAGTKSDGSGECALGAANSTNY